MKIKSIFFCFGIVLSLQAPAQEIPVGILPMQYNGGFAGEGEKARFVAGGGIGFYSFSTDPSASNYFGSYDQFFPNLRTGIGITFRGSHWSESINSARIASTYNSLMLSFSPKFSYKGRHTFAPFIDWNVSYANEILDYNQPVIRKVFFQNVGRIGVLYNSRKLYLGITYNAVSIISRKDLPFYYYYRRFHPVTLQAGYTFQKLPESKFSLTPHAVLSLYHRDYFGRWSVSVDLNLMFRYKRVIWSLNSIGAGLGYQNKNFRILFNQGFFNDYARQSTLALRYVLK